MKKFNPSATGSIGAKADELRSRHIRVYNFGVGDLSLPNHPAILEAAAGVLQEKYSPYPPVAGFSELRKKAAEWMNSRYGSQYVQAQTVVTAGGKFALFAALQVLLNDGEEVLIPVPSWVSYPEMVRLANAVPVLVPGSEASGWKITPQDLERRLTKKSRVLILSNACNPTGALYTKEEIRAIMAFAVDAKLTILSDEVYSELVFDDRPFVSCASFPEYFESTVIVESCSKNFAMGGWRVGFAFGPSAIISQMIALQSHTTTGTSHISQKAALGAINHAGEVSSYVRKIAKDRREFFFKTYNQMFQTSAIPSSSTIYFFAKIGPDSIRLCEEILDRSHVVLIPGIAFGMEGYARFTFCRDEQEITDGLRALKAFGWPLA